jgi:hypothetical protein
MLFFRTLIVNVHMCQPAQHWHPCSPGNHHVGSHGSALACCDRVAFKHCCRLLHVNVQSWGRSTLWVTRGNFIWAA